MRKFWKYLATAAVVMAVTPLMSCDDDDDFSSSPGRPDYSKNYVYLYQPNSTFARVEYKANGDFITGPSDPLKTVPVRITKALPTDLQVEVAIDPSLVDEYNEANQTDYKLLEGASIVNPNLKIAAGEYVSPDSIAITFGDRSGFLSGEANMILPIVIRSCQGPIISKSSRVFLTFNSTYRPIVVSLNTTVKEFIAALTTSDWQSKIQKLSLPDLFSLSYAPFEQVTLNLAIDQSKVAQYNADNGTNYQFKSDAKLESNTVTIGTDATKAGVNILTGDLSGIADEGEYIIPVTLKSATGASVEYGDDLTVYVIVRGTLRELDVQSSTFNGTLIANPVSCTHEGSDWNRIINNDNYSYAYATLNTPIEMDFGKEVNLSAIYINHWAAYYSATAATLKTSVDGTNWTDWGEVEYSAMSAYYINLIPATNLRYVQLTFTKGGTSGDRSKPEVDGMRFYAE